VAVADDNHTVTAIDETLQKSNIGQLKVGDLVNLERCMQMNGRLDGHIVQGHVDQTAICTALETHDGSWVYTFEYDASTQNLTVEKGSICVNGISLTVVNSKENAFSVAIIPYTYEHTNLQQVKLGDQVNLEFDIIGKYVAKMMGRVNS
jgi:riboflavin synthase